MNSKTYKQRAELAKHPLAKKLLTLMHEKETNLALSADVKKKHQLIELCETLGSQICVLKTHIDILDDFDATVLSTLKSLSQKHGFLILEDRKFADIGSTVQHQYQNGIFKISDWSDMVTVHGIAGSGTVQGLKEIGSRLGKGCLLLAEMSSSGNLLNENYTSKILQMGKDHSDFVLGFIAQKQLVHDADFLCFTPGIGMQTTKDGLGQNYKDPFQAVAKEGTDVVIVGRHIYKSSNPLEEACLYRKRAWEGYLERSDAPSSRA